MLSEKHLYICWRTLQLFACIKSVIIDFTTTLSFCWWTTTKDVVRTITNNISLCNCRCFFIDWCYWYPRFLRRHTFLDVYRACINICNNKNCVITYVLSFYYKLWHRMKILHIQIFLSILINNFICDENIFVSFVFLYGYERLLLGFYYFRLLLHCSWCCHYSQLGVV